MPELERLVVSSVHVVRRPANRREFLLVKSADEEGGDEDVGSDVSVEGGVPVSKSDLSNPETLDELLLKYASGEDTPDPAAAVRTVADAALHLGVDPEVLTQAFKRTGTYPLYREAVRRGTPSINEGLEVAEKQAEAREAEAEEARRYPVYHEVLKRASQMVTKGEAKDMDAAVRAVFKSAPDLYEEYRREAFG